MDNDGVDYRPLAGMQDAAPAVLKTSLHHPLGFAAFLFLVIIPVILTLVGIAIGNPITVVIFVPVIYGTAMFRRVTAYKNDVWQSFAVANGWSFDIATSVLELLPPSMQFGYDQAISPIIQARLGDIVCDLFSYNTSVGSGKQRQTYYYTVAVVPLPKVLPHMLLLNKKAHVELQRDLANKQDLQLEGDFDDYFKLQIEQGQQIDALTVITPDVMQALVQYSQAEDVEILGDELFFILDFDRRNPQGMRQLIRSVVELSGQIIQNIALEQGPVVAGVTPVADNIEPGTLPPALSV